MEQSIEDAKAILSNVGTEIDKLRSEYEAEGFSSRLGDWTDYSQERLTEIRTEANTDITKINAVISEINTQFDKSIPEIDEVEE